MFERLFARIFVFGMIELQLPGPAIIQGEGTLWTMGIDNRFDNFVDLALGHTKQLCDFVPWQG